MNGDDEGSAWCMPSPLSATVLSMCSWNRSSVLFFFLSRVQILLQLMIKLFLFSGGNEYFQFMNCSIITSYYFYMHDQLRYDRTTHEGKTLRPVCTEEKNLWGLYVQSRKTLEVHQIFGNL